MVIAGLEDFLNNDLNKTEIVEFMTDLFAGSKITAPYWYQIEATYLILKYRYCGAELATSSGKTLIFYTVFAYLKKMGLISKEKKMLLVVPRVGLVSQTSNLFLNEYYNGSFEFNMCLIGGKNKFKEAALAEADCVIATYQSLNHIDKKLLKNVKFMAIDEAHTVLSNSIRTVIRECSPLLWRFGLSGTLLVNEGKAEHFRLMEYLGPIVFILKAKDLIDKEKHPDVYIKMINVEYDWSNKALSDYNNFKDNGKEQYVDRNKFATDLYNIERLMLVENSARMQFVVKLICGLKMNTLILFNNVKDKYGINIVSMLKDAGEEVYYIDGGTDTLDREDYSTIMEKSANVKIVASFGTFSTGINLKNIYNILFAESYKSPILIRQSIGRGMRKLDGKYSINIIDIVDTGFKYSEKHAAERKRIYREQGFATDVLEYSLVEKPA